MDKYELILDFLYRISSEFEDNYDYNLSQALKHVDDAIVCLEAYLDLEEDPN